MQLDIERAGIWGRGAQSSQMHGLFFHGTGETCAKISVAVWQGSRELSLSEFLRKIGPVTSAQALKPSLNVG